MNKEKIEFKLGLLNKQLRAYDECESKVRWEPVNELTYKLIYAEKNYYEEWLRNYKEPVVKKEILSKKVKEFL